MAEDIEFLFSGNWRACPEGRELALQTRVLKFRSVAHVGKNTFDSGHMPMIPELEGRDSPRDSMTSQPSQSVSSIQVQLELLKTKPNQPNKSIGGIYRGRYLHLLPLPKYSFPTKTVKAPFGALYQTEGLDWHELGETPCFPSSRMSK